MNRSRSICREYWRAPERLTPSQWCEKYIRLPHGASETKPGRVRFDERPYLREPLDSMSDPTVETTVMVMPTRAGKTILLRLSWCYGVAADPAPGIWVDSDRDSARDVSIKEIQPLVEANTILRARKPTNRFWYNNTFMVFPGAVQKFTGAHSPAGVAGATARRIYGNEVDKWSEESTKEASIVELVKHRTESFDFERKHIFSSTPTLETGAIWMEFLAGDQRYFFVPCRHCGRMVRLTWDSTEQDAAHVWWDPDARIDDHKWDLRGVEASACLVCSCGAHWSEADRIASVRDVTSHWRASAVGIPRQRSYQLNGLYGPLNVNRPGSLAVAFHTARTTGFYSNRRDFWNSRMGLPWIDDISIVTVDKFKGLEAATLRGELPARKWNVLIFGGDVQTYGFPWTASVYSFDGYWHTLDHGLVSTLSDIEAIQREYSQQFSLRSFVIIDKNFEDRRAEVQEAIFRRLHLGWFAADGFEFSKQRITVTEPNPFLGGRKHREGAKITNLGISTYDFKIDLEKMLAGENRVWSTYRLADKPTIEERKEQAEYYQQLMDEKRKPRKCRIVGKPPFEWVSSGNNHAWDCLVYTLALSWYLRNTRPAARTNSQQPQRRKMIIKR